MKKTILTLLMVINIAGIVAQEVNILSNYNGDFEAGLTNWRFFEVPSGIGSTCQITSDALSGTKAVKLSFVANTGTVIDRGFDNWNFFPPMSAYGSYTVKAFLKSDQATGLMATMTVGFYDAFGSVLNTVNKYVSLTNIYTEFSNSFIAPPNTSTCWVAFRLNDATGKMLTGNLFVDNVRIINTTAALIPRVMPTTLASEDVPIASINVTEAPYNAKNDGSVDATVAFQNALNTASAVGGAVVYVPAGKYKFNQGLTVPEGVTLRGEWQNPDSVGSVIGTILMSYGGSGNENGTPFITLCRGAGVRNLSIWYPSQSATAVTAYPWTIHCQPTPASSGDNSSVVNVTFVNSYNGIKTGPNNNELTYFRDVYGTALKQGIWLSQSTDISRIENVHFEPKYWSNSGLANAPVEDDIINWQQNNPSIGLTLGRSDWQYIYNLSLVGFRTGMQFMKNSEFGPNGVITGLLIDKSNIGIDAVNVNWIGWQITNATINASGSNSTCVQVGDSATSVMQFNSCTFGGDPKTITQFSAGSVGRVSFENCTFQNWGQSLDSAAINCPQGTVSLIGNTFLLDKTHLKLGAKVPSAHILDNKFPSKLKMDNQSKGEILVSQEPINSSKPSVLTHPFASETRPLKNDLFNVTDFDAIGDGITDNTAAFQAALDKAGQNGGGTVYIPAGMYRINSHLTVPQGVELRGIWDVPHHTISKGTVLFASESKGIETGTPFISLQTNSGVRGITVWYPDQSISGFYAYPWTIQSQGPNCWIKDVTLSNSYKGVDMATYPSSGHKVSYLAGGFIKNAISISNCNGEGWIENCMFNPHFWTRSSGYPNPVYPNIQTIFGKQETTLDAYVFGTATKEHVLGTFVYGAKRGLYLAPDNGNSNIDFIMHGSDAVTYGVYLENNAGSKINFVNTELTSYSNNPMGIIATAPAFGATVAFYNTMSWGTTGASLNLKGTGNLLIQQFHTDNSTMNINNGKTRLENITFSSKPNPQYSIGAGVSNFKLFGSYSSSGISVENNSGNLSAIEMDYYYNTISWTKIFTGWETADTQNVWDNMIFGHKDFVTSNNTAYKCQAITTTSAHTGTKALSVAGAAINGAMPFYKLFNCKMPVTANLSYWLNPQDESGRSGFVDILFTDGTLLSKLSPVADDGLALDAPRGTINSWINVKCQLGKYAAGKTVQTILVGVGPTASSSYNFMLDDLLLDGAISEILNVNLDNNGLKFTNTYPNPFNLSTTINYITAENGKLSVSIYDLQGNKIDELTQSQYQTAGNHQLIWNPRNLDSGIYICHLLYITDSGVTLESRMKLIYS